VSLNILSFWVTIALRFGNSLYHIFAGDISLVLIVLGVPHSFRLKEEKVEAHCRLADIQNSFSSFFSLFRFYSKVHEVCQCTVFSACHEFEDGF
jgi:hypothetical protein